MAKRSKPIHLIHTKWDSSMAACNRYGLCVRPIESVIVDYENNSINKGTFNVSKVTCKKCQKLQAYKDLKDKQDHPLFFWRD